MPKKLAHDDYTVGWICPLEVEQIAALEMLDEEHGRLPQSPGDHNVYNLGSIAGHNIVIAGLHQAGNSSAAVVVTQMRMTFQNLRFGLLVGIGGGVPTKTDSGIICLGDVVVSKPVGGHSGAVQYDRGKAKHGNFERIGSLAPPPVVLLNAAQDLAVKRARAHEDPIGRNVKRIDTSIQGLRRYKYPGPGEDNLYRPEYLHLRPGVSCDECGCDPSQRIQRTTHGDEDDRSHVVVHRGIIASGELVLKNAILRDQLAHDGLLCFEMEAAGAMADFPCMVVRGISDYCDSHKNDHWHGYAAAVAAAYARELFFHVPMDPKSSLPWELLQQARQQDFGETALREKRIEILKLLNTTPYRDRKDRNPDRIQGTCEWFTEHELFLDWQQAKNSRLLWVSADPGCGKSVLAKYLVDSVLLTTASRATCYFFFKDDFEDQRGVIGALCCILHQLFIQKRSLLSERILERFEISGEKFDRSFSELWDILLSIAEDPNAGEIVCILDAIDECEDKGRSQLVQALCKLYGTQTNFNLKFLLTSRPYGGIRRGFQPLEIPGMPIIHLSGENDTEMEKISKEIDIFIKARVRGIGAKLKLTAEEEGLLFEGLMRVPNRTYLWVHLTLDLIESDPNIDKYGIVKTTHNLPKTIDEAYDRILCKSRNFAEAKKLLHIVVAAERPLTLKEMNLALALRKYHKSYTDVDLLPEDRFRENVRDLCGLFVTVNDSRIYLLHQTSKEFLVQIAFTVPPQHIKHDGLEWKESLRLQVSHGILAEICIQRLLFAEYESHPVKKDGMSSQYTDSHVFLDYSAKYWAAHLQDSDGENDITTDLILKLCDAKSNRCLTWLRIYWTSTNTEFPENFNDLMIASYFGLTALVKQKLHRGGIDLNSRDSTYGRSVLSWAAENGSYAIVKLLLKAGRSSLKRIMSFRKGAEVDSTDRYGRTPLSYAAWNGHVAAVKLLLKSGARVDTMDEIGGTPLSYALVNGHDTVVNLLLNKETKIDSEDNISKTLMFEAAKKKHDAVVKLLLEKGADFEEKDDSDRTPLSYAAGNGHETVVKLLLQEGADIESKDISDRTPLLWAAGNGHATVVKLLLENGAQFEYKDITTQNPLLRAARDGHKAVVGLLLEKGAALEVKDQLDRTPLIWAAMNGYDLVVKLLLEKGAEIEFQDSSGQSPLLWAAKNGHDAVVELLLSKNANFEFKDNTGKTPLSWAIESGNGQVVMLLLGKEAGNPDSPELKRVRQIKQENANFAECKMLLLGTSESGKSTIVKQMKVLHQNSYTEEELTLYRFTVFKNLIDSIQALIEAMYSFDLKPTTQENQEYSSFLLEYRLEPSPKTLLDTKVGDAISSLWKDEVIPKVMERQKEFYLMDPATYFFDQVKRISAGNYIPTVDDVLRARIVTTGIYESRIRIGNLGIHMFDVGGMRSERKKWIHCFENVTAIAFCVALSEYDQFLLEENEQNRMMESLLLFDSVVNSRWFMRTCIILFLNKVDLFRKKIPYSPLGDYFGDFSGGTNVNAATEYFLWRFNIVNRAQLNLYAHVTQATDSTNIRLVFDDVKQKVIQNSLKDSKVRHIHRFIQVGV